jgi:hypothetical protein
MTSSHHGSQLPPGEVGTDVLREIGTRLTRIRDQQPQAQFAPAVGLHKNTLGTYERGEREMGVTALARLVGLGWNANWLLTGQGPQRIDAAWRVAEAHADYVTPSQDLSADHLTIALELADEALRGLWLPRRGYAELVALVYDALTQGLPYAAILDIARPAARERAGQGAGDGSEQGLDGPGPSGVGRSAAD